MGSGGGYAARLFLLFSFPCPADHERDWPPCKVVLFGLATNTLNVRNINNNNNICSEYRDGMSESGPESACENCDTRGNDSPVLAGEARDVVSNVFQDTSCRCLDRACGSGSVPYGGAILTNEGHDEEGDDDPGSTSRGRDMACGGGTPHVNSSLSGESY